MQDLFLCPIFVGIVIKKADSPYRTSLCFSLVRGPIILLAN
ncbi:MAG: hypothetical protein JWQ69_3330 [Pseudomonas sp.]|nr:hypothetical protein [Pseudomonas sp.]